MTLRQISLSELRGTKVYTDIEYRLRQTSVLFSPSSILMEGGSGTLIRYKNTQGILTAPHVISKFLDLKFIWSPLIRTDDPTFYLNDKIPIQKVIAIESSVGLSLLSQNRYALANGTLDICLLQIDKKIFDSLLKASGKEAIDLYSQQQLYLSDPAKFWASDNQTWSWGIYGSPRQSAYQCIDGIVHSRHDGLFLGGGRYKVDDTNLLHVITAFIDQQTDTCIHEFGSTKDELPIDFRGISGGSNSNQPYSN